MVGVFTVSKGSSENEALQKVLKINQNNRRKIGLSGELVEKTKFFISIKMFPLSTYSSLLKYNFIY